MDASRGRRAAFVLALVATVVGLTALPAFAHCHAFSFDQSSYNVSESAGHVTISVSRDGSYADSSVQYSTVDGTAKAGSDYTAKSGTISYTGSQLTKQITIPIIDDSKHESTETFQVTLHDGAGCDNIPGEYSYGPPTTVSIKDNDAASNPSPTPTRTHHATPKATPAKSSTPTPTPTPTKTKTPRPTPTPSESPSPTPTATNTLAAAPAASKGGLSGGSVAGIVVAVIVAGGIAAAVVRRRFLA